jgi:hypothetical protein
MARDWMSWLRASGRALVAGDAGPPAAHTVAGALAGALGAEKARAHGRQIARPASTLHR